MYHYYHYYVFYNWVWIGSTVKVRYLLCYIRVWYARMFSVLTIQYIYVGTSIRPCSRKYIIIIIIKKNVTLGAVQGVGIFFLFYLFIFNVQLRSFPSKVNAIFLYIIYTYIQYNTRWWFLSRRIRRAPHNRHLYIYINIGLHTSNTIYTTRPNYYSII